MSNTPPEWQLNVIVSSSITIVIISIVLCANIRNLYISKFSDSIEIAIKILATLQMICYISAYMTALIIIFLFKKHSIIHKILYGIFVIFLIIGIMSSYLLLTYRLYFTFIDSQFKMSMKSICFHIFMVILKPIYISFALLFYYRRMLILVTIIVSIGVSITIIGFSTLIYSFNYNLFQIVLQQRETILIPSKIDSVSVISTKSDNSTKSDICLNGRQLIMIEAITKQSLLGCIQVATIILIVIGCVISGIFVGVIQDDHATILFSIISLWSLVFAILTGVICVHLGFTFNKNIYNGLCGQCHFKCHHICESLAERSISNEIMDKEEQKNKVNIINMKWEETDEEDIEITV